MKSYAHWALMDSFEWSSGFAPKMGLLAVNFSSPSLERTPRDSFGMYAAVAGAHADAYPRGGAVLDGGSGAARRGAARLSRPPNVSAARGEGGAPAPHAAPTALFAAPQRRPRRKPASLLPRNTAVT